MSDYGCTSRNRSDLLHAWLEEWIPHNAVDTHKWRSGPTSYETLTIAGVINATGVEAYQSVCCVLSACQYGSANGYALRMVNVPRVNNIYAYSLVRAWWCAYPFMSKCIQ
jgi:hypothetical protein